MKKWLLLSILTTYSFFTLGQTDSSYYQRAKDRIDLRKTEGVTEILDSALTQYGLQKDTLMLANTYLLYCRLYMLGNFLEKKVNRPKAYENIVKAVEYYQQSGNTNGLYNAKLYLARIEDNMGQHENALQTLKETLNHFIEVRDTTGLADTYLRLGQIFGWENRPFFNLDTSVYFLRKGIEMSKNLGDAAFAKANLRAASAMIRKGYEDPEILKEGLSVSINAKKYYLKDSSDFNFIIAYINEGFAYEAMNQTNLAKEIANNILETKPDILTKSECYRLLSRSFQKEKNYRAALENHKLYKAYEDTVERNGSERKLFEMEKAIEQKELDNQVYQLEKKSQIQELEIRSKNYLILVSAVVILFTVALFLIWYRNKTIRERNRLLELEQKFLQLQMNPHFIFNALAVIQGLLSKGDHSNGALYLGKFSRLMRQTLEYSREEFISLEEEMDLIKNYIEVQKLSTGNSFEYEIVTSSDVDPFEDLVPPMFAQPFIENAILHSEIEKKTSGKLSIKFSKTDQKLILEVNDNGTGVKEGGRKTHKSLSVEITKERLTFLSKQFKTKLDFSFNSTTAGTRIKLELPIIR